MCLGIFLIKIYTPFQIFKNNRVFISKRRITLKKNIRRLAWSDEG
jgi:hypothetical protein